MEIHDIVLYVSALIGMLSGILTWIMGFYIKKQYIKQADMVFLGFAAPADSIFFVLLRSIRYSMLFTWHWHAKRTGELEEVGQFDEKFQKPFKIFLM